MKESDGGQRMIKGQESQEDRDREKGISWLFLVFLFIGFPHNVLGIMVWFTSYKSVGTYDNEDG